MPTPLLLLIFFDRLEDFFNYILMTIRRENFHDPANVIAARSQHISTHLFDITGFIWLFAEEIDYLMISTDMMILMLFYYRAL